MSCPVFSPSLRPSRIRAMSIRVPLIQGRPPQTAGVVTTLSSNCWRVKSCNELGSVVRHEPLKLCFTL